jgi:molecular chaperone DnaJ
MLLHDLVNEMDYTKDYYRILGVTPDSDPADIRDAYKTLMVKYDPDQNRSAEAPA